MTNARTPVFLIATCHSDHEWEVAVAEDGLTLDMSAPHGVKPSLPWVVDKNPDESIVCPECKRRARIIELRPIA